MSFERTLYILQVVGTQLLAILDGVFLGCKDTSGNSNNGGNLMAGHSWVGDMGSPNNNNNAVKPDVVLPCLSATTWATTRPPMVDSVDVDVEVKIIDIRVRTLHLLQPVIT